MPYAWSPALARKGAATAAGRQQAKLEIAKRQNAAPGVSFARLKFGTSLVLSAWCLVLASSIGSYAQIVPDGGNVVQIGGTNFISGNVTIGTNGAFTLLTISENGMVTNTGSSIIGANSTAHDNEVRLVAPTARWLHANQLIVGSNGFNNRLTISSGAFVASPNPFIGGNSTATGNQVVVADPGSLWTNTGDLNVGALGSGNRLIITNGGRVMSFSGVIGVLNGNATNNTVLVTDAGSSWNVQDQLYVGFGTGANGSRLIVSNAAFVDDNLGTVGQLSTNCEAVVSGSGSVWSNRVSLTVGQSGNGARLTATNGGSVLTLGDITLGAGGSSTNNRIVVDGGTVRATNTAGTATLTLFNGTNQFNGSIIEADRLRMDSPAGIFEFNGGLLTTRGAFVSNGLPFVLGASPSGAGPAIWDVRLGVGNYLLANDLQVGSNAALNQLLITNAALLNDNNGILGQRAGANSNLAIVAGLNSVWSNRSDLTVGFSGNGNQLIVSNGGWVANKYGYVARATSSSNNFALVNGTGSVWSNLFDLTVGFGGRSNRFVIEAGALVTDDNGYISDVGGSNNEALVTGPGTVWSNRTRLFVGLNNTAANRLVISNGAMVVSSHPITSSGVGGTSNHVLITGLGSLCTNQADFTVGGAGTRVDVSNGGWVANANGFMFSSASVALSGSGSGWNNNGDLQIGYFGDGNTFTASNAASVLSSNALIGASTSLGNNNFALLTDAGTLWSNRAVFTIGNFGGGNQLIVSNGAAVYSGSNMLIGLNSGAVSNALLLTGAGTSLLLGSTADLTVGSNSSFNWLIISNGAVANCRNGTLGMSVASGTNQALVTDPGSAWNALLNISVGGNGIGNRLVITNGGVVNSFLGFFSSNGEAIVTGSGSAWNSDRIFVGLSQGANRLVVTNSATVVATNGLFIGTTGGAIDNRLTVDGGSLRCVNLLGTGDLRVSAGTNVLNAGLIELDQLILGTVTAHFDFNAGTLSAGGSGVTNAQLFRVGNGVGAATFNLTGNGLHTFGSGVTISSNATLTGNATISGALTVLSGGKLIPGASVGKIVLSNAPSLQGATIIEISKNGATLTNDQIQVIGPLTYGGSLIVNDLGPGTLAAGDNFRLFLASSYTGSFSSLTLPTLGPELIWTNELLVDGSIEVVSIPPGDHFWTNSLGGNYDVAVNWLPNSVPGPRDNAVFTNNASYQVAWPAEATVANAYFDARGGTVTQAIAPGSWSLTNEFVVGRDPSATAAVTHVSGSLRVTNSAGVARLEIGGIGGGTYNLNGGDVTADFLFVTNNCPSFTNSIFNFNFGDLTTLHGSAIAQSNNFDIGTGSGIAAWTLSGGTNTIAVGGGKATRIGVAGGLPGKVTVTGSGTTWSNSGNLYVGYLGSSNQLSVLNGARVSAVQGGSIGGASDSLALISDPGSALTCFGLNIGDSGANQRLIVTNGGTVIDVGAAMGNSFPGTNHSALVTGAGSVWSNHSALDIGFLASGNSVTVSNNGLLFAPFLTVGASAPSSNNVLIVNEGIVFSTNASANGVLRIGDPGQGTLKLNAGNIVADLLLATNGIKSLIEFNGGTLSAQSSQIRVGNPLIIGNGVSPATFLLAGNGTHNFGGTLLVSISSNAVMTGNGTVMGPVGIASGGRLIPGNSIGKMTFGNPPSLLGSIVMEISKNDTAVTNDQIQVTGTLTYGGSLVVSNIGPTALAVGDRFPLFSATSYVAGFTNILLPPLTPGFGWTNKLLVDGSIQVIAGPGFSTVTLSGTNVIFSGSNGPPNSPYAVLTATNLVLPLSNWLSLVTNQFDATGNFLFTNPVIPSELQRYFRVTVP